MSQSKAKLPAPRVWVSRPEGSQHGLVKSLQGAGFAVHYEPMIIIRALRDSAAEQAQRQLEALHTVAGVIFISANAVDSFCAVATASA